MLARAGTCLGVLAVLLLLSCTKVSTVLPEGEGYIPTEALKDLTSIPPEWGNLVSVTKTTTSENITQDVQLWFQDKEGNVRVVTFDVRTNQLTPKALLFRRK
jgi:hypothetical protein